jgi:protease PrsW
MTEQQPTQPTQPPPPPPAVVGAAGGAAVAELPRWGVQSGFLQRRQPAFWLFVILLVFTALTVLTEQLFYLEVFPAGWIFSIVLLSMYVIPVALAIYFLDLFEREPISLALAAFLWGGVVSIGLAVTINTSLLQVLAKVFGPNLAQTWGAAIAARRSRRRSSTWAWWSST